MAIFKNNNEDIIFLESIKKIIEAEIDFQKSNKVTGEVYDNAISYAKKIRAKRRVNYGDEFVNDTEDFLISTIKNKLKRIEDNLKNPLGEEAVLDSTADLVNYSLFLLSKYI